MRWLEKEKPAGEAGFQEKIPGVWRNLPKCWGLACWRWQ
jgi:hypothetical protein